MLRDVMSAAKAEYGKDERLGMIMGFLCTQKQPGGWAAYTTDSAMCLEF